MRPSSGVARARQVTAVITDPACGGRGALWDAAEAAHARASTPEQAADAAAVALVFCRDCPEVPACALRAQLDRYSGLAANALYVNGVARPASTVLNSPPPLRVARAGAKAPPARPDAAPAAHGTPQPGARPTSGPCGPPQAAPPAPAS